MYLYSVHMYLCVRLIVFQVCSMSITQIDNGKDIGINKY